MSVETIPQLLVHAVSNYDKENAFTYKTGDKYVPVSHRDVLSRVHSLALALTSLGLTKGDRIAILSENRLEWAIADLAILSARCVTVPIYPTLTGRQIEYMLRDCQAAAIFVSDALQLEKITSIKPRLPMLSFISVFDNQPEAKGVVTMDALVAEGSSQGVRPDFEEMITPIRPSDWASIIYTSGTTGDPKGAVLTHSNFVSNAKACAAVIDLGPDDTYLSFLPLSHVFERTGGFYTSLYKGVTIAYAESIDTVPQNLLEVRPTLMMSVPRIYEKMYARTMQRATSGFIFKKYLFFWALRAGRKYVYAKLSNSLSLWNRCIYAAACRLVFSKVKMGVGGRLKFFISGGAPLARDIAEFFYAAGLPILEGYGLTETSPVISVNTLAVFKFGTVGKPIPDVEVRIASDGEILVKGPNIMHGYYNKEELTREAFTEGWFRTGDIGTIDDDGFITITDRKKDILVTAGGKNVAPQPIESALKTSKYIAEAVLMGNKRKFISAVIVPNFENLLRFAKAANIPFTDTNSLIAHPKVEQKIAKEIERKSVHLARFEKVKKFILLEKDFSMETNELTPTLKVRRAIIEEELRERIDKLYEETDRDTAPD
jgi:long-chain acyl-CoA synthetase